MNRRNLVATLILFALGLSAGFKGGAPAQASRPLTRKAILFVVTVPGGGTVYITEFDGGLATLTLKDGPHLGLTPIVRDLSAQTVAITVFDLSPGGVPGKLALQDVELRAGAAAMPVTSVPGMTLAVKELVDRPSAPAR